MRAVSTAYYFWISNDGKSQLMLPLVVPNVFPNVQGSGWSVLSEDSLKKRKKVFLIFHCCFNHYFTAGETESWDGRGHLMKESQNKPSLKLLKLKRIKKAIKNNKSSKKSVAACKIAEVLFTKWTWVRVKRGKKFIQSYIK